MKLLKYQKVLAFNLLKPARCFSSTLTDSEYTATPQYPPILDVSYEKKLERKRECKHEEIKNVKTVEEKQIKLNMPRYYGFKTYVMCENDIPYNNLQLTQHVTRTHLIETDELPKYYENIGVNNDSSKSLKEELIDALLLEVDGYRKSHDLKKEDLLPDEVDNIMGSCVVRQLNRIITNNLSRSYKHLIETQIDLDPRIESCWYCGGIEPPERVKSYRRGLEWTKPYENDPVDCLMTYIGNPYLTLRSKQPLPYVMTESDAENSELEVPFWKYDPRTVGISPQYRRQANIPGFWPGDNYKFGILQYLKRGHYLTRKYDDIGYHKEALHRQGILASFAWLNAQANHLGFTTFNDITYPMVSQTIITNGQVFSFYTYQMNTMLLHSKHITENPKRNICWASSEIKLYEKIQNGKLEGLNEDVITKLIKYYANAPSERLGVNLTPYLNHKEKLAADYEDQEKREWLEREYKFITSNRPRKHEVYEIYAWEKIYKIDHDTRFMDRKMRPFELRQNPYKRTLDDRKPRYIPRVLRPDLPRYKGRNAKEFFP
ncbi:hypothetical protein HHI36_017798 [Cryptolaemus montrouzieri]|uniref:28S ribosomal protein S30, mitochondrial n=1 Tax=Cryptolaemus montrouzieri TaxID=559131 RepID=A0ABD2NQ59_9CUCU